MVLHNCRFLVSPRETSHYYQLRPVIFVRLKYADDLPADTASRSFLPTFEAKTRQNVKSPLKFNFFTPLQLTLRHLFSCLRFEFGFHLHCQNEKSYRVPKLNRKIFNNFVLINSTDRIKNVHWLFTRNSVKKCNRSNQTKFKNLIARPRWFQARFTSDLVTDESILSLLKDFLIASPWVLKTTFFNGRFSKWRSPFLSNMFILPGVPPITRARITIRNVFNVYLRNLNSKHSDPPDWKNRCIQFFHGKKDVEEDPLCIQDAVFLVNGCSNIQVFCSVGCWTIF